MEKKKLTKKQQKIIGIAAIVVAVIVTGLIIWRVGIPLVNLAKQPQQFRVWVDEHGIWSRFAYVGMVVLQILIAVLPGEPFEIAAGYAFGAVEGTILCILAETIGSLIVFGLVRWLGVPLVEIFFSQEKLNKVKFLKTTPKRDFIFFIIFMVPGTPKDLLCYVAGLTDMKFSLWLIMCSLGRFPSIITSTVGGNALGTSNYWFAAVVFAVTMLISLIGILIYRIICKKHENE